MRRPAVLLLLAGALGCSEAQDGDASVPVPGREGARKSAAAVRAQRRAYDGAPPVIPHRDFSMDCVNCHKQEGLEVPGVGFAPNMPHTKTPGLSAVSLCRQCHVFRETDEVFRENSFEGLPQDLREGRRHHPLAPPVLPHPEFMRENCLACHTGPAAREEIRCDHPERTRCTQCHLPRRTTAVFSR